MVLEAASVVHQRRQAEDTAYNSGKDFASDDMKKEDRLEDQYMSVIHNILLALMMLPDEEPLKRKAEVAERLYKDFGFSTKAGYEAEVRQYYISSGKPGTDPKPEPQPEPDGGDDQQDGDSDGEVTPVTPE